MMRGAMKAIAPGKLILSGEHAVVYGRPALAMAVNRHAQAFVLEDGADGTVSFDLADLTGEKGSFTLRALREMHRRTRENYRAFLEGRLGIRDVLHKPIELFEFAFVNVLDGLHLKLGPGVNIRLHSNIPIGCGMGSSAATVMSVLRGLGHYFRIEFRPDWYYKYSLEAENLQHGHASGLDTYVSMHGGCVRFRQGEARSLPLPRLPLYVVNTGTPASTTGEAVAPVAAAVGPKSRIWDEFERTTNAFETALSNADGPAFLSAVRTNHRLLRDIGVVPDRVAEFVAEIEKSGGAAKICGAGAVSGDAGGMLLVAGRRPDPALCAAYGCESLTIRPDPMGVRIV